jgi:hypothetical protein
MAQKKENVITDFGDKIGGARKDIVKANRIDRTLIKDMNEREILSFVTKTRVLPKMDYQLMIESGVPLGVVYFIKTAYDRLPKMPRYTSTGSTEDACKAYMEALESFELVAQNTKTKEDAMNLFDNFLVKNGFITKTSKHMYSWTEKAISSNINIKPLFKACALSDYSYLKLETLAKSKNFGEIVETTTTTGKPRKTSLKIIPPQLTHVVREGYEHRQGRNVTGDDYLRVFGFKGGEFGNWTNQNDRQVSLNYGYDALLDLACLLKCTPQSLSLNNTLSIAFGSRGVANARAHYEPLRKVINLTKLNGSGSLAHEAWHALDDFLGEHFGFRNTLLSASSFSNRTVGPYWLVGEAFKNLLNIVRTKSVEVDGAYRSSIRASEYQRNAELIDSLTSSTGRSYWAKPEELLARAFSCYVQDRLGIRSDYLEGGNTNAEYGLQDPRIKPFPEGEERQSINKAFDRLFEAIRECHILEPETVSIDLKSENTTPIVGVFANIDTSSVFNDDSNFNQIELELY